MVTVSNQVEKQNRTQYSIRVLLMGPSLQQNGGMAEVQKLICRSFPDQFNVRHICTHDEGSVPHRVIIFGKAIVTFSKHLLVRDMDLIHIHMSERGSVLRTLLLVLLAFSFRYPVLIHTHGAEFAPFFLELPKWVQGLTSYFFRQCSGFIVLSQSWNDFYRHHIQLKQEKVFTLPNSVSLPTHLPKRSFSTSSKLFFCGRVGQRKGAFDLIRAFALLPEDLKSSTDLIFAGDGEIQQAEELAEKLGLAETVHFLGWMSSAQRDQLLGSVDIFVLPSYNEGLPLSILEAMAWGLPIISTPVGGISEVVLQGHNGLLVEPGQVKQLSQSIQYLIENPSSRRSMGENARETAKSFDSNSYTQKLLKIYDQILHQ